VLENYASGKPECVERSAKSEGSKGGAKKARLFTIAPENMAAMAKLMDSLSKTLAGYMVGSALGEGPSRIDDLIQNAKSLPDVTADGDCRFSQLIVSGDMEDFSDGMACEMTMLVFHVLTNAVAWGTGFEDMPRSLALAFTLSLTVQQHTVQQSGALGIVCVLGGASQGGANRAWTWMNWACAVVASYRLIMSLPPQIAQHARGVTSQALAFSDDLLISLSFSGLNRAVWEQLSQKVREACEQAYVAATLRLHPVKSQHSPHTAIFLELLFRHGVGIPNSTRVGIGQADGDGIRELSPQKLMFSASLGVPLPPLYVLVLYDAWLFAAPAQAKATVDFHGSLPTPPVDSFGLVTDEFE